MQTSNKKDSFKESGYLFIKSCLHHKTGLARRLEGERFTTPYANALAAMALIHENDLGAAEKIFDPFQRYYQLNQDHFNGLPQLWNVETGLPDSASVHWEGDAAFLALALSYHRQTSKNDRHFQPLRDGLFRWLQQRAGSANVIIAEGIADMAASLAAKGTDPGIQKSFANLRQCFFSEGQICSRDYQNSLSHIVRGALVFNDSAGLQYYKNYVQSEVWGKDGSTIIRACRAFAGDSVINVEVSAQLLLVLKLFNREAVVFDGLSLISEIEKLKLKAATQPHAVGLPINVSSQASAHFENLPALEPTCFLLFYYWGFNPFLLTQKR